MTDLNERVAKALGWVYEEDPHGSPNWAVWYWRDAEGKNRGYVKPDFTASFDLAMRDGVPWLKARGYWISMSLNLVKSQLWLHRFTTDEEEPLVWYREVTDPPSMARAICEAVVYVAEQQSNLGGN